MNVGDVKGRALTAQQRVVLEHVADGLTLPEIAKVLHVSQNTARTHLAGARTRLGARSSAQAVAIAFRKGVLQ